MKIKFLGTGGFHGIPVWNCNCKVCKSKNPKDKRFRSSVLLEIKDKNIVIDFGPDFRQQLLKNKIKKIDYAFLTHAHRDHMSGNGELSKQKNLIFESPKDVLKEFLGSQRSLKDWFLKRNPTMKIRPFKKKRIGNLEIDTIALKHQKDYVKRPVPCYGYLFKTNTFSIAYMSDYNEILEPNKLKNMDLIISDGNGLGYSKTGHMGIKGSIDVFNKFKPKRMIMTHIKHTKSHVFLSNFVKKFGNIEIAFDGMEIDF